MDYSKVKNVISYYEEHVFPKWLWYYKKYYLNVDERKSKIKDWQTNIASGLLTRVVSTFVAHLYDHTFKFYISRHKESEDALEKSDAVETALSWAYHASKTKQKVIESFIDTVLLGEGYGKVFLDEKKKKVEYYEKKTVKKKWADVTTHVKKSFMMKDLEIPSFEYKSPFACMLEPYATDFDDAYMVELKYKRKNEIIKDYSWYLEGKEENEKISETAFEWYKSWETAMSKNRQMEKLQYITWSSDNDLSTLNENYKLQDKDEKYEVLEIRDNETLTVFVSGKELFSDINPYPIKQKPHLQIRYSRSPGTIRGLGLWFYLDDYDKLATELINTFVDDAKMKSVPVLVEVIGSWKPQSLTWVFDFKPGQIIQVESIGALSALNLWGANIQLRDLMAWLMQEAFMIAGINEIVMGAPLIKVDRSATSTTGRIQGFKSRMMELFDSINDAFARMAEMWLWMMMSLDIKDVHFFDDEKKKTIFAQLDRAAMIWQYDVIFDMQPLRTSMKELLVQKKINFLQVAQGYIIDPATKKPLLKVREIIEDIANAMDISSDIFFSEEEIQKMIVELQQQQMNQMWWVVPPQWNMQSTEQDINLWDSWSEEIEWEGNSWWEVHNQLLEDALNLSV